MAELKTRQNNASVAAFIAAIEDQEQRSDAHKIATMMRAASGREGDRPIVGFSPRKQNISIYFTRLDNVDQAVLRKLVDWSIQYVRRKYSTRK
ncbi:MAG: hypothetical protein OEW64_11095 [Gammaproteobacteria bacterium]|nr:hypothetical protein [Gammaproteobacteria bacterium]MDH5304625.1 hypothetical protein [Gammaproteobacteria bacterium]MDH5322073.1 hypothetical protein [Gammaproteobacteria bacterium]